MALSTPAVDDSEVGLIEGSANGPEPDEAPDAGLMSELAVDGVFDGLDEGILELPPKDGEPEEEPVDDEPEGDEPKDKDDDDEAEDDDQDADEESDEPEEKPKSRRERRIQKLVEQNRELTASFEAKQAQLANQVRQALDTQRTTYEQQVGELTRQLQYQQQLLQQRATAEEEKGLSEVERFRRKTIAEAEQRAEQRVLERVAPVLQQFQERFEARERAEAAAAKKAESQRILGEYAAKSKAAREKILLAGIEAGLNDEETATMDDMLLSYIASKDVAPEQAAAGFRKLIEKLHKGLIKSKAAPVAKGKKKPTPPPTVPSRKPSKEGVYRPTWEALQGAGYANYMQWHGDGRPRLKEPA